MRSFISKVVTGSVIAAGALAISACTKTEAPADNATVTDLNSTETMDTKTDNMTGVDTATNDTGAIANDTMVSNETTTNTTSTTTENKM